MLGHFAFTSLIPTIAALSASLLELRMDELDERGLVAEGTAVVCGNLNGVTYHVFTRGDIIALAAGCLQLEVLVLPLVHALGGGGAVLEHEACCASGRVRLEAALPAARGVPRGAGRAAVKETNECMN